MLETKEIILLVDGQDFDNFVKGDKILSASYASGEEKGKASTSLVTVPVRNSLWRDLRNFINNQ